MCFIVGRERLSMAFWCRNLTRMLPFVDIVGMAGRQNYRIRCHRKPCDAIILQHFQLSETSFRIVWASRGRFLERQPPKREPRRM